MTVLAILVSLIVGATAAWWVAQTPGKPTNKSEITEWAQASANRSLVAVVVCSAMAGGGNNAAPGAGAWLWIGPIVAAVAVIGFTLTAWITDPAKRVPLMAFPLGWALIAFGVAVWVTTNTEPVIEEDAVDITRPFVVGQQAALLVAIVGAVHTWWVWKSRVRRRKRSQARMDAQVRAMRARIEREQRSARKPMKGKSRR